MGYRWTLELETLVEQLTVLTSRPMPVQDEMLAETPDQMDGIEPIMSATIASFAACSICSPAIRRRFRHS